MRKRDFMDTVRKTIRSEGSWGLESTVQAIVRAAEATGMQWDPEEPELPEELWCDADGRLLPLGYVSTDRDLRRRYHFEAAHRYNAWPKLHKLVKEALGVCARVEDYARLKKLEAVLDGKEGA